MFRYVFTQGHKLDNARKIRLLLLLPSLPAIAAVMNLDLILVLNEAIALHITLMLSAYLPKTRTNAANSPFALNSALAATLPPTESTLNSRPNTTREIRQFPNSKTAADNCVQQYRRLLIPLCMVNEFDLPQNIIDRQLRKMKMISPSNIEVDINIENAHEYIGMCRREVFDCFLRDRATSLGAKLINGIVHKLKFVVCVSRRSDVLLPAFSGIATGLMVRALLIAETIAPNCIFLLC